MVSSRAQTPPVSSADGPALERRLGPFDAAGIIVANVIGGGILFFPPGIAANTPETWVFLSTWVAGGLLAFCGAMAYAELAALRPRAGGEYVYLREAYGRLAGFLTGWTSFIAGFAGAVAASAMIVPFYLERFAPGAANSTPWVQIPIPYLTLTVSNQSLIAIAIVWLMAIIHIRGVGPGRVVSNALTILKVAALLCFIVVGLAMSGSTAAPPATSSAGAVSVTGWLLGLIVVMFVYSGWNAAAYMAEEVRNPGRNLPLALALGTGAVTVIYILINVLYLKVIPIQELVTLKGSVLDVAAERLIGVRAGDVMGLVSIIGLVASVNAMTFAGPARLLRDGARRCLPARRGPDPSDLQDAVDRDCRAGGLGDRPDPDRQPRRARQLRRVRDHAVRRHGGRRGVRAAGARAARAAALQGDRLPADAGHLRALQRRHGRQCHLPRAAGQRAGHPVDRRRDPRLPVVHEAREGRALSASSVSSASAPSLAANSRNDGGDPRRK